MTSARDFVAFESGAIRPIASSAERASKLRFGFSVRVIASWKASPGPGAPFLNVEETREVLGVELAAGPLPDPVRVE